METTSINKCGVCEKRGLSLLWNLPNFPLTEKYGSYDPQKQLHFDQDLLICDECGHVQLHRQMSPHLLYTSSEYSFRTSQSQTARSGTEFFFRFFEKMKGDRKFNCLLDVGGNDLYLAKMVDLERRFVVDPVCSENHEKIIEGVKILGQFIEEVDFAKENLSPDLIFCRHVLEHISSPKGLLDRLFMKSAKQALYIFEIPCFENLTEANRFDAIFHQHYHYFDLSTFKRLIFEAGGSYLGHDYNRQGPCGGSLLIAFSNTPSSKNMDAPIDMVERKEQIKRAIENYKNQMDLLAWEVKKYHKDIYGYGASLMLATLAYHLKTDFSELICILDDDEQKDQIGYQNIPVIVRHTQKCGVPPNSNFLITSLENRRGIFNRLANLSARRILSPLVS